MKSEQQQGPKKTPGPSFYRRLRIVQAELLAKFLVLLGESRAFHGLLRMLRTAPVLKGLAGWGLAFRKVYGSFAEAQQTADRFIPAGHEHEDNATTHTRLADRIRESDYPILYYWKQIQEEPRKVFDFGGNVGNVFYAYDKLLAFPQDFQWFVYDIPEVREAGKILADARQESHIYFVDSMNDAAACSVFLASGCLHYFSDRLDEMLEKLPERPRHVFANRTPVTDGPEIITLQHHKNYLVPCKIHNRAKFVKGMERLGYKLKGNWPVHELALNVPLYPESSSPTYSGFYFELESSRARPQVGESPGRLAPE